METGALAERPFHVLATSGGAPPLYWGSVWLSSMGLSPPGRCFLICSLTLSLTRSRRRTPLGAADGSADAPAAGLADPSATGDAAVGEGAVETAGEGAAETAAEGADEGAAADEGADDGPLLGPCWAQPAARSVTPKAPRVSVLRNLLAFMSARYSRAPVDLPANSNRLAALSPRGGRAGGDRRRAATPQTPTGRVFGRAMIALPPRWRASRDERGTVGVGERERRHEGAVPGGGSRPLGEGGRSG